MQHTKRLVWMSCLCGVFLVLRAGAADVQAQCVSHYTYDGEAARDYLGLSVSGAGDVDNDGYADVIVGAYGNDAGGMNDGRAYVYSGQTGATLWTFTGSPVENLGYSVSGAGDVDNDGYDDLIVGTNASGATGVGQVYVYSGLTGVLKWTFLGQATYDRFGFCVSGAGDVNNDGYDDLIVGAHGNDVGGPGAGRAYVYSGLTGLLLWTFTGVAAGDWFGFSVSDAGDVDNDGYADLIVGARNHDAAGTGAGRAYVYSGRTGLVMWMFDGAAANDRLGWSVSGVGDVDNDGYADLIVGAPWNDAGGADAGRAYLYSGQTGLLKWTLTGEAAGDWLGTSVSGAGDIDNDGYDDLLVGAAWNDAGGPEAGRVYVYSGQTGALMRRLTGETAGDYFGYSVSDAADVDADGYADLIVGAHQNDAGGEDAGRAYVYTCTPCECDCHGDPSCDGVDNILDVVFAVNVAFRNAPPMPDPNPLCPVTRTDVNCDGITNVIDVVLIIDVAIRGIDPALRYCDPCAP